MITSVSPVSPAKIIPALTRSFFTTVVDDMDMVYSRRLKVDTYKFQYCRGDNFKD